MITSSEAGTPGARLRGKVALITGASRGIGHGIALEFARQGAQLVLNANSDVVMVDGGFTAR